MDGPPPPGFGVWHPRLWDMHLFARPDGTPVIGVVDGSGNAGLDPSGSPGGGSTFPGASFFFPARVP